MLQFPGVITAATFAMSMYLVIPALASAGVQHVVCCFEQPKADPSGVMCTSTRGVCISAQNTPRHLDNFARKLAHARNNATASDVQAAAAAGI
jgi:hypothetical protein